MRAFPSPPPFLPVRAWALACVAFLAGGLFAPARAEEPLDPGAGAAAPETGTAAETAGPDGDLGDLSLEALMAIEVPTVTGASRHAQQVTDAAASVSIVTREEIVRYGYRTLADVLRSVRGFYTSGDRQYVFLGTRGFLRGGDYNSRLLLLINGHRVNDNVYDSILAGTEGSLDIDLIERVEVIRGPGSSIYGASAFFGVINVETRAPSALSGFRAGAEAASFGTGSLALGWGRSAGPGGRGPDIVLSASGLHSDGQDLHYPEYDDPATNGGRAVDSDNDRNARFFGQMRWGRWTLEGVHSTRTKRVPTGAYDVVFNDPRNRSTDSRSWLSLRRTQPLGERWELQSRAFLDRYAFDETYVYDYPPVILNRDETRGYAAGVEFKGTGRIGASNLLTAGAEYRDDWRQDQKNFDVGPDGGSVVDSRESGSVGALYVEDEARLSPRVSLTLGGRYDHYQTFGGTFNPRAALIVRPREGSALKFLAGRAFRAPNVYELFYDTSNSLQVSNKALEPETIRTAEIAWDQYFGSHARLAASAFYYRLQDLISITTEPATGALVYENLDSATSRGLEFEAERRWAGGFEASGSYAFADARDGATGDWLANSPRHLARVRFSAPVAPKELLRAGLQIQYSSRRRTLSGGEAGQFAVVDLTLLSRELTPGLDIQAVAANIFDRRYSDPASEELVQQAIEQDGRSFRLRVSCRF